MMRLGAAAQALHAQLLGGDAEFTGVNSDTRKLQPGELFVALQGPNFDGHDFVAQAQTLGAVGALTSRRVDGGLPQIVARDTRLALGELAAHWRRQFNIPLIAITGSNGKTTVKNMTAAILAQRGAGLVTQGNLNNDIGMPLTLLRLRAHDRFAVIEMGMNHLGEIEYLTNLARPTIALINNAAAAHLEGLGSVENVARAKGEIFSGLAADGVAVINADDRFADFWRGLAGARRVLTFGLDNAADVRGSFTPGTDAYEVQLTTPGGSIRMSLSLLGKHNVANALAAGAAALSAGATLEDIKQGLEKLRSASGRLEIKAGVGGARVLDDTYNANPGSLAAGLEVLREAQGERVLVMGDMGELGEAAPDIHRRVGEMARKVGVERFFAVGDLSKLAVASFGTGAQHFRDHDALVASLQKAMHADMTVLVKGSRMMRMERVVQGIVVTTERQPGKT